MIVSGIELQDGRVLNTIMHKHGLVGGLPLLSFFSELYDIEDYPDFQMVNENDSSIAKIEEGITLEDIRCYLINHLLKIL